MCDQQVWQKPEETAVGEIDKEQKASNKQPHTQEMASGCLVGWESAALNLSISDPFIIVSFIKEAKLEMES